MIRDEKYYVVELLAAVLKDRQPRPPALGCDSDVV